ncbi:hypothetical protein BDB01DRAFT_833273 [Pilobolus umbonatus]|nr:hypothetical protein BDB01DRAFT_833273 [Pilobolus umbonatus]
MSQHAIHWPRRYTPGLTDNFVSNEIFVKGIQAEDVWPYLVDTSKWTSYYDNVSSISFPEGEGPELRENMHFSFGTFGFPPLSAEVVEFVPPTHNQVARISWTAKQDGQLDVLHAWLIEDVSDERVRILTQESQIGRPAKDLADQRPNPMLNGHQDWLVGLRDIALKNKLKKDPL